MNVLFIYSSDTDLLPGGLLEQQDCIPFGISYIASFLQKHGHQAELIVLSRLFGRRNTTLLKEYIHRYEPKVICFTAVATQYGFMRDTARYIRRLYPEIYLLIGGIHSTLNPQEVLSGDFDALCIGEGERPVLELVSQLENGQSPSGIPNMWIKHGSQVEKNPPREFLQDLDSLPFPERTMWQPWMARKLPERCSVLLSRGCPFNCSYCSNHSLRKIAPGAYVRYRSPENIVAEIEEILIRFPTTKECYLETETITFNADWCLALCLHLERFNRTIRRPMSFGANIRITPNVDLETIFASLKSCNFRFVNFGLESGSERVRREVLRRDYSNEEFIDAVKLARKYGLQVAVFNLIGVPGETFVDFKETVRINRICKPDWHFTGIYFPYPGTDLHSVCKKQGLLRRPLDQRRERKKAVLDLPGFSKKQVQKSFKFFDYYVYRGFSTEDTVKIELLTFVFKVYGFLIRLPFLRYVMRPVKKCGLNFRLVKAMKGSEKTNPVKNQERREK